MPCNIGYREISRVRIPKPQTFKEKTEAPKIDSELLVKIGEDDPKFLEWMKELDVNPLLREALKRALAAAGKTSPVKFRVDENGFLEASSNYADKTQKKEIEGITNRVFSRFQMEVLAIVAQLLDYEIIVSQTGIEGEKNTNSGVNRYLKITEAGSEDSLLQFEHFESQASLKKERRKFVALAQKLGIKIAIIESESGGQPIAEGALHKDFLKEGGS